MRELGYVPEPEQYASAGDLLFIENSVEARTFFEESYEKVDMFSSVTLLYLLCVIPLYLFGYTLTQKTRKLSL